MFGFGTQEIIVIFLILFAFTILYLPFLLRRRYPNKLWIGLILCFVSGTAQFYLPGGLKYFIGLIILYVLLEQYIGNSLYALFIVDFFQLGVMYWRFLKQKRLG